MPFVDGMLADPDRTRLGARCPIDRAVSVFGSRSSIVLLRESAFGTCRFGDFVRRTGLTEPVTAARLKALTQAGLLEKSPYQEPGERTRYRYVLTDAGRDAVPIVIALGEWADRHDQAGLRLDLEHDKCGETVSTVLLCDGGHVVDIDELRITPVIRP